MYSDALLSLTWPLLQMASGVGELFVNIYSRLTYSYSKKYLQLNLLNIFGGIYQYIFLRVFFLILYRPVAFDFDFDSLFIVGVGVEYDKGIGYIVLWI